MSELITVAKLRDTIPWWPYSTDGTYRMIRIGRLPHVKVGRNVFLTRELVEKFIAEHAVTEAQP
jgi:excisionase family DNA binding protein